MSIAMPVPVAITMAMVGISSSLCVPSTIVMSIEAISVSKAVWVVTIGGIEGLRVSLSDGLRSGLGLRIPLAVVANMSMTVAMTTMVATMPTMSMVSWQCTGDRREGQNNHQPQHPAVTGSHWPM